MPLELSFLSHLTSLKAIGSPHGTSSRIRRDHFSLRIKCFPEKSFTRNGEHSSAFAVYSYLLWSGQFPSLCSFLAWWYSSAWQDHSWLVDRNLSLLYAMQSKKTQLHPEKCVSFANFILWCSRWFTKQEIKFSPKIIKDIQHMERSNTRGYLQQFICSLQWMRCAIPGFSSVMHPSAEFLEKVYAEARKGTERPVNRVSLSRIGWGKSENLSFSACKNRLAPQTTFDHCSRDL